MLKKSLFLKALLILGVSQSIFAHYFYTGGSAGITDFNDTIATSSNDETHDLGHVGFIGGIFAGYDWQSKHCFDFGIEAFFDGTIVRSTVHHYLTDADLKVSSQYSYGIRALPGFQLTSHATGFLLIGYARGNFKISDNGTYGIINELFNSNGFQAGLGTKVSVSEHFDIRTEIIYAGYGKKTLNATTTGGAAMTYKNKLSNIYGKISFIYKFTH